MPVPDKHTCSFLSRSPEQTRHVGAQLGRGLETGDLVCLQGNLGSGKTTLVQGMAQGWGALDRVTSPTFILVNEYGRSDGKLLFHLDAYRLESAPEAAELDIDRLLSEGALLVEWPERIESMLPADELRIVLGDEGDEQRRMLFTARGWRYDRMLQALQLPAIGVS